MLQGLWDYTFKNEMIRFEDFAFLNHEKDIFEGPFNEPGFLSSSEKTYMEFWRAQRSISPLSRPSMVHLDSGIKLAFLVDVFGALRLTHW